MKKLFFGLFAAAIAIGGSAFTNAQPKHVAAFNYVLTAGGSYVLTTSAIDEAGCQNSVSNPCWVGFNTTQGQSFPASQLPSKSPSERSTRNGIYIAP